MTDTRPNVPRGLRPSLPKRPAIEGDAWEQIQAAQEQMKNREYVRFSVFRVDPAWRRLPKEEREDLYYDHCHLKPSGNTHVGREIADYLTRSVL